MRMFVGLILGLFVAVGAAYVHDSALTGPNRNEHMVVNWDAFNANIQSMSEQANALWDRVSDAVRRRG